MRKYVAMLCAAMLFVCCLALGACSNGGSASASASGSASAASASASSASAQASFAGDWKFAGLEMDMGTGKVTMVGDLEAIAAAMGETSNSMQFGLSLKDDGTGSFISASEAYDIAWKDNGKGITISNASEGSSSSASASSSSEASSANTAEGFGGLGSTLDFTYSDGALSTTVEKDGQSMTIYFSKDGKLSGATEIKADSSTPITKEADLIGSWSLSGMNMLGLSIYGDADTIASLMGGSTDTTLKFEAGGKCVMFGSDAKYTVGADGATIVSDSQNIPVKALGDDIMIDMSDMLGMELITVYSK